MYIYCWLVVFYVPSTARIRYYGTRCWIDKVVSRVHVMLVV